MWKIMNGCECCTNVCNPQDNDTDYDMGIIVSVPGERVPRKRYPIGWEQLTTDNLLCATLEVLLPDAI